MAEISLQGNPIKTKGDLPEVGTKAPDFSLTKTDLSEVTLNEFSGKKLVLNIFPSLDTEVCASSVRKFNEESSKLDNVEVLCISKDLPFAHGRFCETEGIDKVVPLSEYKNTNFGDSYGVTIENGPLEGLFSRAIVIVNESGDVVYNEHVPEIVQEPDYAKALEVLNN